MKGIQPTENFIKMLEKLHDDYTNKNMKLADILPKYFGGYLHNRIGTLLTNTEMNNVSLIPVRNLNKGKMVIYQERFGEYKWAMYSRENINNGKHFIYDKRNGVEKEVFLASLRSYPDNLKVDQSFDKGHKFMEEDLLDIYIM